MVGCAGDGHAARLRPSLNGPALLWKVLPASQATQPALPFDGWTVPAVQFRQRCDGSAEKDPGRHGCGCVAPLPQYAPASQALQLADCVLGWFWPTGQSWHAVVGAGEYLPALHGAATTLLSLQKKPTLHAAFSSGLAHTNPRGHVPSALAPCGQNAPAVVHATAVVLLGQKDPAGQRPSLEEPSAQ